jgi:hypothetical protein
MYCDRQKAHQGSHAAAPSPHSLKPCGGLVLPSPLDPYNPEEETRTVTHLSEVGLGPKSTSAHSLTSLPYHTGHVQVHRFAY